MPIQPPPPPHSPHYYPAPDLLRTFIGEHPSQRDAAAALGISSSELSHWTGWRQRPGDEKKDQVAERSSGRIPREAWISRAEREEAARASAEAQSVSEPPVS